MVSNLFRIIDLVIQCVLLIPMLFAVVNLLQKSVGLYNILSLQFVLGSYQIMSGVVGIILSTRGRLWKAIYFMAIAIYYIIYIIINKVLDGIVLSRIWEKNIDILMISIIPVTIGVVYFAMSVKDYIDYKKQK